MSRATRRDATPRNARPCIRARGDARGQTRPPRGGALDDRHEGAAAARAHQLARLRDAARADAAAELARSPTADGAAALDVGDEAAAFELAAVEPLERALHLRLHLELDEAVAARDRAAADRAARGGRGGGVRHRRLVRRVEHALLLGGVGGRVERLVRAAPALLACAHVAAGRDLRVCLGRTVGGVGGGGNVSVGRAALALGLAGGDRGARRRRRLGLAWLWRAAVRLRVRARARPGGRRRVRLWRLVHDPNGFDGAVLLAEGAEAVLVHRARLCRGGDGHDRGVGRGASA
jgi:hypothetical protein